MKIQGLFIVLLFCANFQLYAAQLDSFYQINLFSDSIFYAPVYRPPIKVESCIMHTSPRAFGLSLCDGIRFAKLEVDARGAVSCYESSSPSSDQLVFREMYQQLSLVQRVLFWKEVARGKDIACEQKRASRDIYFNALTSWAMHQLSLTKLQERVAQGKQIDTQNMQSVVLRSVLLP